MNPPQYFQMADGYACYRPVGEVSLPEAIDRISQAIAHAREHKIKKLLVNITGLTGIDPLGTWDRFYMSERFAQDAKASLIGVMVAPAERIDPRKFGVTVARNRGLFSNIFSTEEEAVTWLLDPNAE